VTVWIADDDEALSREAAQRILRALTAKPNLLLCAAGGSTPRRAYQLLVENHASNPRAFQSLRIVKLDEWGGIAMDDPGSCETQLRKLLVDPLDLSLERYFGLRSDAETPELECEKLRDRLAIDGAIDLCVLGLGTNGHLGMNEPGSSLQLGPHVAFLSEATFRHPMLAHSHTRPTYGLTLGMGDIMASLKILLLVSGANKRDPLQRLMQRVITTQFPASFLWLHPNCYLLCDRDAAQGLKLTP